MRGLDADAVLGGRYRLTAPVAVGGMGEVWQAVDDLLDRVVAVKVLKPEFAADAGFLDRFRSEARNSARLSHPNIAQLYDYGEDDGRAYLVMELVPGEPLSDLIAREGALGVVRAAEITAATARGLAAAHRGGLVHRDVKPGNLLVTPDGSVKITDFGISRATSQSPVTATGEVMGTAAYLAPEQALGRRDIGPASDLYAVGVVLHEMLSGSRPFGGDSQVAIAMAQVSSPPPPLPASVGRGAAALVASLLVKDPEQRPSQAAGVASVADSLAAGDDAGALSRLRAVVPGGIAPTGLTAGAAAGTATAAATAVVPGVGGGAGSDALGEGATRAMPAAVGGGVDPTAVVAVPVARASTAPLRGAGVDDREPSPRRGAGTARPRRMSTPLAGLLVVLVIILLAAIIGIVTGVGGGPATAPSDPPTTTAPSDGSTPAPSTEAPTTDAPSSSTSDAPTSATPSTTSTQTSPSSSSGSPVAPGSGDTRPTQPAPADTSGSATTTEPPADQGDDGADAGGGGDADGSGGDADGDGGGGG